MRRRRLRASCGVEGSVGRPAGALRFGLILYIYAIVGVHVFAGVDPENWRTLPLAGLQTELAAIESALRAASALPDSRRPVPVQKPCGTVQNGDHLPGD
jgi:hypothetical protein